MRRQQNHPKTWQAALAVSTLVFGLTACSGGGHSSPPPGNAVPTISALSPDHVTAGGSGFTLTVNGSNFISSSVVNWNDSPRTTSFVNSGQLTASISQGDIAAVGTAQVSVFNPPPDGGSSSSLMFSVSGAQPSITSLSPASRAAGGSNFTLTVNGTNFNSGTVVRWNGQDRVPTMFLNGGQVTASIPSTDTAAAGIAQVKVFNPGPGGGESAARNLPVFLGLSAADLIYGAVNNPNNWIYASVPAGAPPGSGSANTITAIDPVAGRVLQTPAPVNVANDPGPLAISDDGQFLYVGLNQAPSVRRLTLSSGTLDPPISLGSDALRAESLQVIQGTQGTSFAVARKSSGTPRNAGVAVFDGDAQRPTTTDAARSPNVIKLCSAPSVLFGLNVGDGLPEVQGFYVLIVDENGVRVDRTNTSMSGSDISFAVTLAGERIFSTSGQVLNVVDLSIINAFPVTGLVKADATVSRVFFLTQNPAPSTTTWTVRAFDMETFAPRGDLEIPGVNGNPSSLIRWGTNGLAFRTDSGQVFLLTSTLVAGP